MVRFFEKLQKVEKRQGSRDPEWLQTHPLSSARVTRAETIISNDVFRYGQ